MKSLASAILGIFYYYYNRLMAFFPGQPG